MVDQDDKISEIVRNFERRLRQSWPKGCVNVTQIEETVARIEREVSLEITTEIVREQSGARTGSQVEWEKTRRTSP